MNIPNPRLVLDISPSYAGCIVQYIDIFGCWREVEVTDYEVAAMFPDYVHEILAYIEEADMATF